MATRDEYEMQLRDSHDLGGWERERRTLAAILAEHEARLPAQPPRGPINGEIPASAQCWRCGGSRKIPEDDPIYRGWSYCPECKAPKPAAPAAPPEAAGQGLPAVARAERVFWMRSTSTERAADLLGEADVDDEENFEGIWKTREEAVDNAEGFRGDIYRVIVIAEPDGRRVQPGEKGAG